MIKQHQESLSLLLQYPVNVNAQSHKGITALMIAAKNSKHSARSLAAASPALQKPKLNVSLCLGLQSYDAETLSLTRLLWSEESMTVELWIRSRYLTLWTGHGRIYHHC